jgi:murein DD-endopeptidase MepM/ murein hydrolase activator NlpD
MQKTTIVVVPPNSSTTRQMEIPSWLLRTSAIGLVLCCFVLGFVTFDYFELRSVRRDYHRMEVENQGLRGEARILMDNLEGVKQSLRRVQDYSTKLNDLTALRVKKVTKKTGIGPLSEEEYRKVQEQVENTPQQYLPLGLNPDKLIFRTVFGRLKEIGSAASHQAVDLQRLLSSLSQQKSLLSSIPSISPVNGWITSGFGYRVSPFTGRRAMHRGIDVASPIGSPIYAPADGVVIFTGAKAGFGNFLMLAHGYGMVSRYGHLQESLVAAGQKVRRGEQIATVGMSGRTTGPHLHYEIVVNGSTLDPKKFILNIADDWLAL